MELNLLPKSIRHRLAALQPAEVRVFWQELEPVRQKGPQCGLVALKMAGSFFGTEIAVEEIFSRAKALGLTRNGEIFSKWLVDFGRSLFPGLSLLPGSFPTFLELVNLLEAEKLLLVAYDCDKNHEPTRRNGHKSHWALILGFVVSSQNFRGIQSVEVRDLAGENLSDVYLLTRHGKSSLLSMWSYEALRENNGQLEEAGPDRPGDEYIIPRGGIQLKNKCVCISRQ